MKSLRSRYSVCKWFDQEHSRIRIIADFKKIYKNKKTGFSALLVVRRQITVAFCLSAIKSVHRLFTILCNAFKLDGSRYGKSCPGDYFYRVLTDFKRIYEKKSIKIVRTSGVSRCRSTPQTNETIRSVGKARGLYIILLYDQTTSKVFLSPLNLPSRYVLLVRITYQFTGTRHDVQKRSNADDIVALFVVDNNIHTHTHTYIIYTANTQWWVHVIIW